MAVSVTGPRAVNDLGGPAIPGIGLRGLYKHISALLVLVVISPSHSLILGTNKYNKNGY